MYDEYFEHPSCPCCDKSLTTRRYYDDVWGAKTLVETALSCSCGYNWVDSYGSVSEEFPEGYDDEGNKIEGENK